MRDGGSEEEEEEDEDEDEESWEMREGANCESV